MFQSTHPHGVRLAPLMIYNFQMMFQSTHPHGVRPSSSDDLQLSDDVSIHAPTRGATGNHITIVPAFTRFNPRTHTGCDRLHVLNFLPMNGFNPRTHTGCDVCTLRVIRWHLVSIHAPTRGATFLLLSVACSAYCFNPRTHTGCDFIRS